MVFQPPPQRRDNGLRADVFVALADVDPRLGEHLLDLLRLADIAAYLEPPADPRTANRYRGQGPIERLFVQSDLRRAARDVVLDAAREAGASVPTEPTEQVGATAPAAPTRADPSLDLLAGVDTDAEFARIMAGFDHTAPAPGGSAALDSLPSAVADRARSERGQAAADAVDGDTREVASGDGDTREGDPVGRDAEVTRGQNAARAQPVDETGDGAVDDALDDAEEHFVPPPAPPFPVPRASTVGAVAVLLLGLLVLARGAWFGLGGAASFPIGVILVLVAVGLFVRGLREADPEDVDPDDGAIV